MKISYLPINTRLRHSNMEITSVGGKETSCDGIQSCERRDPAHVTVYERTFRFQFELQSISMNHSSIEPQRDNAQNEAVWSINCSERSCSRVDVLGPFTCFLKRSYCIELALSKPLNFFVPLAEASHTSCVAIWPSGAKKEGCVVSIFLECECGNQLHNLDTRWSMFMRASWEKSVSHAIVDLHQKP